MPAVPTIADADLRNLQAASFQRVRQETTLIINIPPVVSRVTSSRDLEEVNERRALRAAGIAAENQERASQAASATPPLPAPTPISAPAPLALTAQGYAYQVRPDLGGGFPDNLRLTATPGYAVVPDLNNPVPDLASRTRRWQLLWDPSEDQCSSEVNPYERLWQFTITFVSDLGPEYATPIHFNLIAQSRSLVTAGDAGARGSSYGGPPETKYGEYQHWPLPWYVVHGPGENEGELDIESAMGVHYFEPPSIGRRVFDFAQPNGALNRQVFDLEPGDYTTEDFGGEEPTTLPDASKYLITDVELYIDFTGETMSWKGIEYIAAPDVSNVLRVEPLGIDRLGGYFGRGLVSADGKLYAPWGRTPSERAKRLYEIDLERKMIAAGPGPLGEVAFGYGSYNAIGVLSDGRIYWSSERVNGRVGWSMPADLSEAPGVGRFSRNHGRFNWQGPNGLNGVGAIRAGARTVPGEGIMRGIASDGTSNWGITPNVQGSNGDGTWFDYNAQWFFLLNLNATARTYQNPRAWRLRIDNVNLESPQGLAWYRGRLVLTDVHASSNSTTLHVVNQYSGQVFPASATIEGLRIGGLDVMDGRLLGITDEDVYWLGAWQAEAAPPPPLRTQFSNITPDGGRLSFSHQFSLYDGYAYEIKQAAGASEALYSDAAPLNSPIAARRGYASWGPAHSAPATGARPREIVIKGGKPNTTYTLEARNVFLPNNADSDWDYSVEEDKRIGIPGPPGPAVTFTTAPAAPVVRQDFARTTATSWHVRIEADYPTAGVNFFYRLGSTAAAARAASRVPISDISSVSGEFTRTGALHDEFSYIVVEAQTANGTSTADPVALASKIDLRGLGWTLNPSFREASGLITLRWNPNTAASTRYPQLLMETSLISWNDYYATLDSGTFPNPHPRALAAVSMLPSFSDVLSLIGTTSKQRNAAGGHPGRSDQNNIDVTGIAGGQPYFLAYRLLSRDAEARAQSDWAVHAFVSDAAGPGAPSASLVHRGPALGTTPETYNSRGADVDLAFDALVGCTYSVGYEGTFRNGATSVQPGGVVQDGFEDAASNYANGRFGTRRTTLRADSQRLRSNMRSARFRVSLQSYGTAIIQGAALGSTGAVPGNPLLTTDGGLSVGTSSPYSNSVSF